MTCKTCQFNDNGYCQKFGHRISRKFINHSITCTEYMEKMTKGEKEIASMLDEHFDKLDKQSAWEIKFRKYYFIENDKWNDDMGCPEPKYLIEYIRQTIKEERQLQKKEDYKEFLKDLKI